MVWYLCDPNLSLPCNVVQILTKCLEIGKRCHIHFSKLTAREHLLKLKEASIGDRAVRGDNLNQVQPLSVPVIEYHIWQLIVLSDGDTYNYPQKMDHKLSSKKV